MTSEDRERVLSLCRQMQDEKDQQKILALSEELSRVLDSMMWPQKAKAKRAASM